MACACRLGDERPVAVAEKEFIHNEAQKGWLLAQGALEDEGFVLLLEAFTLPLQERV